MSDAHIPLSPEFDDLLCQLGQPLPLDAVLVTGGADTRIWRVTLPDGDFALRLMRPEQRQAALRERAAMDAARAAGLPAPGVRAAAEVAGHPVLLLDWLPGETVREALIRSPHRAGAIGKAFGEMQARLHQVPAPAAMMRADYTWIDWADPDPILRQCLDAAADGPAKLLHLDYHPLNVLVAGEHVTGVLDWTNAAGGDPRADVARTYTILRFTLAALATGTPLSQTVAQFRRAWWRAYWQETARRIDPGNNANSGGEEHLAPFLAWAGLVMLRDLSPRPGRADLPWLTEDYLVRVRRWTSEMTRRAKRARRE